MYFVFYRMRFYLYLRSLANSTGEHIARIKADGITYSLAVDPANGGLDEDVLVTGIREYPNVYEFRRFLEGHREYLRTYIDAGANIGYYAVYAAKILSRMKQKTSMFAVEPVLSSFEMLKRNLLLNNIRTMRTIRTALGDRDGTTSMIVEGKKNLSRVSTVSPDGSESANRETVPIMKLGTIFRKFGIPMQGVTLRWDIEGYEYELVSGTLDFFKKLKKSAIIIEFHPFYLGPQKSVTFLSMLENAGFTLNQVVSCEPLYFLHLPPPFRQLARQLFIRQYHGPKFGIYEAMRDMKTLKNEFTVPESALYHYPNLHLYLVKQ